MEASAPAVDTKEEDDKNDAPPSISSQGDWDEQTVDEDLEMPQLADASELTYSLPLEEVAVFTGDAVDKTKSKHERFHSFVYQLFRHVEPSEHHCLDWMVKIMSDAAVYNDIPSVITKAKVLEYFKVALPSILCSDFYPEPVQLSKFVKTSRVVSWTAAELEKEQPVHPHVLALQAVLDARMVKREAEEKEEQEREASEEAEKEATEEQQAKEAIKRMLMQMKEEEEEQGEEEEMEQRQEEEGEGTDDETLATSDETMDERQEEDVVVDAIAIIELDEQPDDVRSSTERRVEQRGDGVEELYDPRRVAVLNDTSSNRSEETDGVRDFDSQATPPEEAEEETSLGYAVYGDSDDTRSELTSMGPISVGGGMEEDEEEGSADHTLLFSVMMEMEDEQVEEALERNTSSMQPEPVNSKNEKLMEEVKDEEVTPKQRRGRGRPPKSNKKMEEAKVEEDEVKIEDEEVKVEEEEEEVKVDDVTPKQHKSRGRPSPSTSQNSKSDKNE